jgi:hypothetical protein
MRRAQFAAVAPRMCRVKFYSLGIALLAGSIPVLADTPALIHRIRTAGCYCLCEESQQQAGCVKMCDSKRTAPRWWSKTCAKPHMQTPAQDSHAGPRFPRPGRAEHAQL